MKEEDMRKEKRRGRKGMRKRSKSEMNLKAAAEKRTEKKKVRRERYGRCAECDCQVLVGGSSGKLRETMGADRKSDGNHRSHKRLKKIQKELHYLEDDKPRFKIENFKKEFDSDKGGRLGSRKGSCRPEPKNPGKNFMELKSDERRLSIVKDLKQDLKEKNDKILDLENKLYQYERRTTIGHGGEAVEVVYNSGDECYESFKRVEHTFGRVQKFKKDSAYKDNVCGKRGDGVPEFNN